MSTRWKTGPVFLMASLIVFASTAWYSCRGKPESPAEHESPYTEPYDPSSGTPGPGEGSGPSDPAREMALQEAALNGDTGLVRDLISQGVDVNAVDGEGRTALMYASFNGHIEIVQDLLDEGAGVGMRDGAGRTALLYASTGPFPETVRLLLENNADPNITDAGEAFTPLMHAAAEGQLEVVRILLEYGADPSLKDVDGDNAYIFALRNGHTEVAELLKPD